MGLGMVYSRSQEPIQLFKRGVKLLIVALALNICRDVITGINQETVFSKILWDGDRFGKASREDHAYFTDYVERYAAEGADVYLLEYTRSRSLAAEIREYCRENGFVCYISDSVELD